MTPAQLGLMVPIIGIIAVVALAIIATLTSHRLRMQRAELRHRERLAAIDKGLELPPDPPDGDPAARDVNRFLRSGLLLVGIGVVVTVAMMVQLPGTPYLFGLIPAAVGLANLVYYVVRRRDTRAEAAPPPAA